MVALTSRSSPRKAKTKFTSPAARGLAKVTVGSVSETYTAPPELCAATLALRAAHFRREAGYYLQIGRWVHA